MYVHVCVYSVYVCVCVCVRTAIFNLWSEFHISNLHSPVLPFSHSPILLCSHFPTPPFSRWSMPMWWCSTIPICWTRRFLRPSPNPSQRNLWWSLMKHITLVDTCTCTTCMYASERCNVRRRRREGGRERGREGGWRGEKVGEGGGERREGGRRGERG